jgi:hypothetical protein
MHRRSVTAIGIVLASLVAGGIVSNADDVTRFFAALLGVGCCRRRSSRR